MTRLMYGIQFTNPDGFVSETTVARGRNGDFWMQAEYLEVSAAELEAVRRDDPSKVEREPRSGRVFVEVGALLDSISKGPRWMGLYHVAAEHLKVVAEKHPLGWDAL